MNKLTCIITFANEGIEVERTVKSIRETTKEFVDIILINDSSNDNYDYKNIANNYKCNYYETPNRFGVAGSRDFGVSFCKTPYFILLDGHMRFYQKNWDEKLVNVLNTHPNSIITSASISMWLNDDGTIDNEDGMKGAIKDSEWDYIWKPYGHGCYINVYEDGHEFSSAWAYCSKSEDEDLIEVPSIMGAAYASSVEHWRYIKGLKLLRSYGNDEAYMSMKTWLLGGKCYLLRKFGVGHLYRNKMPYNGYDFVDYKFNHALLAELFCDEDTKYFYEKTFNNIKKTLGENEYNRLMKIFDDNKNDIEELKKYIKDNQKISLKEFFDNINYYALPEKYKNSEN